MFKGLTRREFIKTTSLAALGFMVAGCGGENSAATAGKADLVVYGKIFTSEDNKIVEAFAVKDGKFVYVGDKAGAEPFIDKGKTEIIDYTDKGLVMPGFGNGHAHYSIGHGIPKVGMTVGFDDTPQKFLTEIVPAAVKKARDNNATAIFGFGWQLLLVEKDMPTRQQLDAICSDIPITSRTTKGTKVWRTHLRLSTRALCRKTAPSSKRATTFAAAKLSWAPTARRRVFL